MTTICLSQIYDIKAWDGDGFIYFPARLSSMKQKPKCICVSQIIRNKLRVPAVLIDNNEIYRPTRFMIYILGHVYGGVIKYDDQFKGAKIYIYDDGHKVRELDCDADLCVEIITYLSNDLFDNLNNLTQSYIGFYYTIVSEQRSDNVLTLNKCYPTPMSFTMPFKGISLQNRQKIIEKKIEYINNLNKSVRYSIEYAAQNRDIVRDIGNKAKEVDKRIYLSLKLSPEPIKKI